MFHPLIFHSINIRIRGFPFDFQNQHTEMQSSSKLLVLRAVSSFSKKIFMTLFLCKQAPPALNNLKPETCRMAIRLETTHRHRGVWSNRGATGLRATHERVHRDLGMKLFFHKRLFMINIFNSMSTTKSKMQAHRNKTERQPNKKTVDPIKNPVFF